MEETNAPTDDATIKTGEDESQVNGETQSNKDVNCSQTVTESPYGKIKHLHPLMQKHCRSESLGAQFKYNEPPSEAEEVHLKELQPQKRSLSASESHDDQDSQQFLPRAQNIGLTQPVTDLNCDSNKQGCSGLVGAGYRFGNDMQSSREMYLQMVHPQKWSTSQSSSNEEEDKRFLFQLQNLAEATRNSRRIGNHANRHSRSESLGAQYKFNDDTTSSTGELYLQELKPHNMHKRSLSQSASQEEDDTKFLFYLQNLAKLTRRANMQHKDIPKDNVREDLLPGRESPQTTSDDEVFASSDALHYNDGQKQSNEKEVVPNIIVTDEECKENIQNTKVIKSANTSLSDSDFSTPKQIHISESSEYDNSEIKSQDFERQQMKSDFNQELERKLLSASPSPENTHICQETLQSHTNTIALSPVPLRRGGEVFFNHAEKIIVPSVDKMYAPIRKKVASPISQPEIRTTKKKTMRSVGTMTEMSHSEKAAAVFHKGSVSQQRDQLPVFKIAEPIPASGHKTDNRSNIIRGQMILCDYSRGEDDGFSFSGNNSIPANSTHWPDDLKILSKSMANDAENDNFIKRHGHHSSNSADHHIHSPTNQQNFQKISSPKEANFIQYSHSSKSIVNEPTKFIKHSPTRGNEEMFVLPDYSKNRAQMTQYELNNNNNYTGSFQTTNLPSPTRMNDNTTSNSAVRTAKSMTNSPNQSFQATPMGNPKEFPASSAPLSPSRQNNNVRIIYRVDAPTNTAVLSPSTTKPAHGSYNVSKVQSSNLIGKTKSVNQEKYAKDALTCMLMKPVLSCSFDVISPRDKARPWVTGSTIGPNDEIILVDHANCSIKIFDHEASLLCEFGQGVLIKPYNAAMTPSGKIAVIDKKSPEIKFFSLQGRLKRSWEGEFQDPCGIMCDNDGNVLVTDLRSRSVQVYTSKGTLVNVISMHNGKALFRFPYDVCPLDDNLVIMTDNWAHNIKIFNYKGELEAVYGKRGTLDGQLLYPTEVCTDLYGNIIVADHGNSRIHLVSRVGTFLRFVLTSEDGIHNPDTLAITSKGHFIITQDHMVVKIFKYRNR